MRSRNLPCCPCCGLSAPACPGADTPRIATRVGVVIVVHAFELHKTSNTARLARRVLSRCELRVHGGRDPIAAPALPARRLLLFPAEGARELCADDARDGSTVLVVPDGTWGQARRMMRRDPVLIGAEPVTLPPGPASSYSLRRAREQGMLSTYEAVARAMGILEGPTVERAMLEVFDRFVERMLALRGARGGQTAG
ncbi:MAG TPA: tRNA-uridine aminocarboxypropyltransferase [Polyangiaceae bacterium]|nr:tRNA-uridine aminocarboxypropyltransferase [Polyangiaceae bacterium]